MDHYVVLGSGQTVWAETSEFISFRIVRAGEQVFEAPSPRIRQYLSRVHIGPTPEIQRHIRWLHKKVVQGRGIGAHVDPVQAETPSQFPTGL